MTGHLLTIVDIVVAIVIADLIMYGAQQLLHWNAERVARRRLRRDSKKLYEVRGWGE